MADYIELTAFSASTELPLAGLTPTWHAYVNSETGYTGDTGPTISEIGDGAYRFEDIPAAYCGIIDFGAGTAPQYVFIGSATQTVVPVFTTAGAPNASATLTWVSGTYQDSTTGASITPEATFTNLTGGMYRVDGLVENAIGTIDSTAANAPRYQFVSGVDVENTYFGSALDLPSMTLAGIRQACQQRADMVGSEFITDAEWTSWINNSLYELYDILIQAYGNDYFATSLEFTTDGTDRQTLPTDFLKALGVDYKSGNGDSGWTSLRRYNLSERNRFSNATRAVVGGVGTNIRYRLFGNNIQWAPTPSSGLTMRLWYIPKLDQLVYDSDTFNGFSGWLEYVINDVAAKALEKEESDSSVLLMRKAEQRKRIEQVAENRDAGQPMTVTQAIPGRDWDYNGDW